MAIERTFPTSNAAVRDALAEIPREVGTHVGGVVMPDFPLDAEAVQSYESVEHKLNLSDLRASGAKAKEVIFEGGSIRNLSVVEHAQKSTMDTRDIERAGAAGIQLIANRSAMHRMDIEDIKEYRIAQLATTPANFGLNNKEQAVNLALAGIKKKYAAWAAAVKKGGYPVTDMIVGSDSMTAFSINPDIQAYLGDRGNALVDEDVLKAYFRVPGRVVVADYSRVIDDDEDPTDFWPNDFVLLVSNRRTISTRTFGVTPVVPYGAAFGRANVLTDVRTAKLSGVEGLTEIGAFQRYNEILANADLGFLVYDATGF